MVDLELAERDGRKIDRLRKQSKLPGDKTLASLDRSKLPTKFARQLPSLCDGGFVERAENILAFGLPGRGKSHVLSAIGHELVHRGISVFWTPTYRLVQKPLIAKRDLVLEAELRRLDRFAVAPPALRIERGSRRFATRAQTFEGLRPSFRTAAVAVRSTTTHG